MTVHVHNTITGISVKGHGHNRDPLTDKQVKRGAKEAKGTRRPDLDTERTWAFDCTPKCEQRMVEAHPLVATLPGGVVLTSDEQHEKGELESRANLEVGKLAQALSQVANERVLATTTAAPAAPKARKAG